MLLRGRIAGTAPVLKTNKKKMSCVSVASSGLRVFSARRLARLLALLRLVAWLAGRLVGWLVRWLAGSSLACLCLPPLCAALCCALPACCLCLLSCARPLRLLAASRGERTVPLAGKTGRVVGGFGVS